MYLTLAVQYSLIGLQTVALFAGTADILKHAYEGDLHDKNSTVGLRPTTVT